MLIAVAQVSIYMYLAFVKDIVITPIHDYSEIVSINGFVLLSTLRKPHQIYFLKRVDPSITPILITE